MSIELIWLKEERNRINSLLQKTVEPTENILELKDVQKQDFAKAGLGCHKPNDNCAFCGNPITEERYKKVKSYFSSDDIEAFENEIQDKLEFIEKNIKSEGENINIDEKLFYPEFQEKIKALKKEIMLIAQERRNVLNSFKSSLKEKKGKLFKKMEILNEEMPEDLKEKINEYNGIVERNNQYTKDLERNKEKARKKFRYHKINVFLKKKNKNNKNYDEELESIKDEIQILEKEILIKANEIEKIEGEITDLKNQKEAKEDNKKDLLASTKNTEILANNINKKIKGTVNFRLCRNKEESGREFYEIKEKIDGGEEITRPITKLSDGEKNIIAFLYFIESLNELGKKRSGKDYCF